MCKIIYNYTYTFIVLLVHLLIDFFYKKHFKNDVIDTIHVHDNCCIKKQCPVIASFCQTKSKYDLTSCRLILKPYFHP